MQVFRKIEFLRYRFQIVGNRNYIGISKHTFGIMPIHLQVKSPDKVLILKQNSLVLKIINSLPILNLETFTPFYMYDSGKKIGCVRKCFLKPIFNFEIYNQNYVLSFENNHKYSLKYNDKQIALFLKKNITIREKNEYFIEHNKKIKTELLLIICMLIDMIFYPNNLKLSYLKKERDFVIKKTREKQ